MKKINKWYNRIMIPWLALIVAGGCAAASISALECGFSLLNDKESAQEEQIEESNDVYSYGSIPESYPDLSAGN